MNNSIQKEQTLQQLRMVYKTYRNIQKDRKAIGLRLSHMKDDGKTMPFDVVEYLKSVKSTLKSTESAINYRLEHKILPQFPIYNKFLKDIKGVGPVISAGILGYFNIQKAKYASCLFQYGGINPQIRKGKKSVEAKKLTKNMDVVKEIKPNKDNPDKKTRYIIETNYPVRGDKSVSGYVNQYNKDLKCILLEYLGSGLIKQKVERYTKIYYKFHVPKKDRNENYYGIYDVSERLHRFKNVPWKDLPERQRHRAAIRKMVKQFLIDLYVEWRTVEGLPVNDGTKKH